MSPGFMDRNNNNNEPVMGPLSWKLGAIIIFGSNIIRRITDLGSCPKNNELLFEAEEN